jgi:hypothetical protein
VLNKATVLKSMSVDLDEITTGIKEDMILLQWEYY